MPDAAPLIEPIPTGLSEEEDAQRYLALRFNTALFFCRNCEVHYEACTEFDDECPICCEQLALRDAPPRRRKHT